MKLSEDLLKILSMNYEKSSLINSTFKRKDISIKTDNEGNPVLLFIGKRTDDGTIKGERYVRTLKRDKNGNIFKDHWELKGRSI
ncbi:hypothetical protein WG906_01815 [Pedobacter sp. P351]|uniref:hypothetical protein n=1 Tax=Pedobacter superstes TaxID=3133441 RepID=UPI003096746C